MSKERPTVRPVTLARLAEVTHLCEGNLQPTEQIETELEITHRRARETILEAQRLNLVHEYEANSGAQAYRTTEVGQQFIHRIRKEDWLSISELLEVNSPHYKLFLRVLSEDDSAPLEEILSRLQALDENHYTFNDTSVEVLGDWAERLGVLQRNAFTGHYYSVEQGDVPPDFPATLLSVFDRLETSAGINLKQRYLSIPELREYTCEELSLARSAFDSGLLELVDQNIGKIELSGAPIDTGAKEAQLGIKQISASESDGVVSTSQSTDQVMAGVEQFDKQYYYLAVHDTNLKFTKNNE